MNFILINFVQDRFYLMRRKPRRQRK